MPSLPTKSFQAVVASIVTGMQGRASNLINFSQGSALRAIAEGFGGVFLWFQSLVLQLLMAIRLSTSTGIDVDTFTADFMPPVPGTNSPRLSATPATGVARFTRLTAGPSSPVVLVGSQVNTADGLRTFNVYADLTAPTYSPLLNGYVMAAGFAFVDVPVVDTQPGTGGNIEQGQLTVMASPITGVDQVINVNPFINGIDVESDAALKKRFSDWILGLSRGDMYGTIAAIEGSELQIQWAIKENYNLDGSWRQGFYLVVVDDGSGNPSTSFMQTAQNAIDAVRPLGIELAVFPPTLIMVTVAMILTVDPTYDHQTVVGQVAAIIAQNIDGLGLGNDLTFTMLCGWPYTVPGVVAVNSVFINGRTGDISSISTKRLTQDGMNTFVYATIKCQSAVVS
jgi:hypothetical protein